MRVLAFGSPCDESVVALQALSAAGVDLIGLIVAEPPFASPDLLSVVTALASARSIPVRIASRVDAATIDAVRRFRPDVVVAACFPWRLPAAALAIPPLGCLNLHPSLLPRGRGPDPVFWTYRRGERDTGVTVHLMDAGFDTGPVLGQRRFPVPAGSRASELEQSLMAAGGELAAALLPEIASGILRPVTQDDALASFAPIPVADDYLMSTGKPAAWAYTFARGVALRHGPLAVLVGETGKRLPVEDAVDYAERDPVPESALDDGQGLVRVRFGAGWVRFIRAGAGRYPLSLSPIRARDIR